MKHKFCKIFLAMTIAGISATVAGAQPQDWSKPEFNGEKRQMPSVDEIAQKRADAMDRELALTEKQYKKIVKYYKAEAEKEREMMQASMPEGMPEGFPGGKPDFGGGRPPMGGPGMAMSDEDMEKYFEQQDKKLKKILTAEQYDKWRTKHPAGQLPMPEPSFK